MSDKQPYSFHNIFETFDSSEHGLDSNEANFRLKKYGLNQITTAKKASLLWQFVKELADPMSLLLIVATIFAFFTGDSTDALLILIVILLNTTISLVQKHRAEKAIEALQKLVSPQARVIRNRQQLMISTKELVPGDVIIINEGDTVPADAIIFQGNEVECSEAVLKGESVPVAKAIFNTTEKGNLSTIDNIIFTGTTITRGHAKAIIFKTGAETEFGKIAKMTQETKKDTTPLEKEIHHLGVFAAQVTLGIIAIIFVFELLVHQRAIVDDILFSASIAVAAVPEGLPAVITIALALGVQRLSKKKAIIRQLSSVETLGATTVICTDKTGTLTKNEMTVTQAFVDNFLLNFEGVGYEPHGKITIFTAKQETLEVTENQIDKHFSSHHPGIAQSLHWFSLCARLCNNSNLHFKENRYEVIGDPTEGSLYSMALKIDRELETQIVNNWEEIHELPFDSNRKMMSKIFLDRKQGKYFVFAKGAPEVIVPACDQRLHGGKPAILTKGIKEELIQSGQEFSQKALRTLALAYRELSPHEISDFLNQKNFQERTSHLEKKLTFIGLTGMIDPPRPEVKEAIELTRIAGIRTIIITGDNGATAAAIAEQIGLSSEKHPGVIITGEEIDTISDTDLKKILATLDHTLIFARNKPEHKLRIVSLLKENGEIVAVTGDGVNDAPALKRADIGVAMGITGSDVSRETASLVLMDDSFKTIVTAVEEGRIIFSNLKKFIFYIFSSNIGEVVTIFLGLMIGLGAPLSAILILMINFVTDLFPALALSLEPAEKNLMKTPPRNPADKLMSKNFIQRIIVTGLSLGLLSLALYTFKLFSSGWSYGTAIPENIANQADSMVFMALVLLQVTNSFNSKTNYSSIFKSNPFNNPSLIWANLSSTLIALAVVELPALQPIFHTSGLGWLDYILIIAACLIITIILELYKHFNARHHHAQNHPAKAD